MSAIALSRSSQAAAPFLAACATLCAGLIAPAFALVCAAAAGALSLVGREQALRWEKTWRALAGPLACAASVGLIWRFDAAIGVLFVWRVIADARWSHGAAQRVSLAAGAAPERGLKAAHLYATPALGIAVAAFTAPHVLVGLPLDLPHVPLAVPLAAGAVALFCVFDWGVRRLAEWRLGGLAHEAARHVLAHHALFLAAYVISPDVSAGLMAMIVWRFAHAARG